MNLFKNLKEKISATMQNNSELKEKVNQPIKDNVEINGSIYMQEGSSIVCKDKKDNVNKYVQIVPMHINDTADNPIEFPQFDIAKTTSVDGQIGMYKQHVLTLDADENPTEGSKKLLTSGTIFELLEDVYKRIENLENKPRKK